MCVLHFFYNFFFSGPSPSCIALMPPTLHFDTFRICSGFSILMSVLAFEFSATEFLSIHSLIFFFSF